MDPQSDDDPAFLLKIPRDNRDVNDDGINLYIAMFSILRKIYKNVSEKLVFDSSLEEELSGESPAAMYVLVDDGEHPFILHRKDLDKLIDFSLSTFPFLINEMKDVRPEEIVFEEIKQKIYNTIDLYQSLLDETTDSEE